MNSSSILVIILIFLTVGVNAQAFKLGKLDRDHFDIALTEDQQQADAVVLHRDRNTSFIYESDSEGWVTTTTIYEVIQIHTEAGYAYATQKIPLYNQGRGKETLKNLTAFTYNQIDGKVKRTKIDKDQIIEKEFDSNRDEILFVFPSISAGSIIEYEYEITSTFWHIDDLIIQQTIPVRSYNATIGIPQFFKYNIFKKGFIETTPKFEARKRNENFTYAQKVNGMRTNKTKFANMKYIDNIFLYALKDIPTLPEEPLVNNPDNYKTSIVFELASFEFTKGEEHKRSSTWEDVAVYLNDDDRVGGDLGSNYFLDEVVDEIKATATSTKERIDLAYAYVQKNIAWNPNKTIYYKNNIRKAFNDKEGSSRELNNILVSILRKLGLQASPIMASTKAHGIPLYPTVNGFDYVIAGVVLNDEWLLLDATEKGLYPGVLPERILNWEGRILKNGKDARAIDLFPKVHSKKSVFAIVSLLEDGSLSGKARITYTNQEKLRFDRLFYSLDPTQYDDQIQGNIGLTETSEILVKTGEAEAPSTLTFSFVEPSENSALAETLYIEPVLIALEDNPFQSKERTMPIDFSYPKAVNSVVTIKIPEGYQVKSLPSPKDLQLPEGIGSFDIEYNYNNGSVQIVSNFTINQVLVRPELYELVREFFSEYMTVSKAPIALNKI